MEIVVHEFYLHNFSAAASNDKLRLIIENRKHAEDKSIEWQRSPRFNLYVIHFQLAIKTQLIP